MRQKFKFGEGSARFQATEGKSALSGTIELINRPPFSIDLVVIEAL